MVRSRKYLFDGLTVLSILSGVFCFWVAAQRRECWSNGYVAVVSGQEQVIRYDPMLLTEAGNWAIGSAAFFLPPSLRLLGKSIMFWHCYRGRKRLIAGRRRTCGYDLRASPARCPECGMVPPDKEVTLT